MKIVWKRVALYVLRVIELIVSGAAGGAMTQLESAKREAQSAMLNFEC